MGITWLAFDVTLMADNLALFLTVGVQGTSLQPAHCFSAIAMHS